LLGLPLLGLPLRGLPLLGLPLLDLPLLALLVLHLLLAVVHCEVLLVSTVKGRVHNVLENISSRQISL
jgi:hypothetical protein